MTHQKKNSASFNCIAEIGVLYERGEINNIPEEALELLKNI